MRVAAGARLAAPRALAARRAARFPHLFLRRLVSFRCDSQCPCVCYFCGSRCPPSLPRLPGHPPSSAHPAAARPIPNAEPDGGGGSTNIVHTVIVMSNAQHRPEDRDQPPGPCLWQVERSAGHPSVACHCGCPSTDPCPRVFLLFLFFLVTQVDAAMAKRICQLAVLGLPYVMPAVPSRSVAHHSLPIRFRTFTSTCNKLASPVQFSNSAILFSLRLRVRATTRRPPVSDTSARYGWAVACVRGYSRRGRGRRRRHAGRPAHGRSRSRAPR